MTTKTIEQLKAEAQAAADAVLNAERNAREKAAEARRALEQAKAAEQHKKVAARFSVIAEALVTAIQAAGGTAEAYISGDYRKLPAVRSSSYVDITEERSGSGYWARELAVFTRPINGKLRIVVGSYGDKVSYPQKADGTFNYAKIAETIVARQKAKAEREAAQRVQQQRSSNGSELANALRAELDVSEHGSVTITGSQWRSHGHGRGGHEVTPAQGKVLLSFGLIEATPEQVRVMVEAARKCGLLKVK